MNPEQWQHLEKLYFAAMEQPVEQRLTFIDRASTDDEIRDELKTLLTGQEPPGDFLEKPALDLLPTVEPEPDLPAGIQLLHYRVIKKLGQGGMGVVYHAKDTRLNRDVAIKLLPAEFADDLERLTHLRTEAQAIAALSHPHIAGIHQMEVVPQGLLLVLELIEGETLAKRLSHGPMAIPEVLTIAKEIADALHAAHEAGVIHLDLKPTNIMITADGHVKIMDFGTAKRSRSAERTAETTTSRSRVPNADSFGIFGSVAYMSPEQVSGIEADSRADVWAFGCVFFELLTRRPAFGKRSTSETLKMVVSADPDWELLPNNLPLSIRLLLQKCLRKDRSRRLRCLADVRIEIEDIASGISLPRSNKDRPTIARRAGILLPFVLLGVAGALGLRWQLRQALPAEIQFQVDTPPTDSGVMLALSTDGRQIVFVASGQGVSQLYLRSMDSVVSEPLSGTQGASYPFWSPNARSLAFFAEGKLKRIDLISKQVVNITSAPSGRGGTWNAEGTIVFTPQANGVIHRISENGENRQALTHLQGSGQRFPQFLPDGHHFVYRGTSSEGTGLYLGSLDTGESKRLRNSDSAAAVAPDGHLLFIFEGTLFSQSLDVTTCQMKGVPVPTPFQVRFDQAYGIGGFTMGRDAFAYRPGSREIRQQLASYDRSGNLIGTITDLEPGTPRNPELSPDGMRMTFQGEVKGNVDVWLIDEWMSSNRLLHRLTFDGAHDTMPVWSHDGRTIIFSSDRNGVRDLYQKAADGTGQEQLLLASNVNKVPIDVSTDGRLLLFRADDPETGYDIWALPLSGPKEPFPVVKTAFVERNGQFSPDGRMLAYESNESGRYEVYIQSFPASGGKWQVSVDGGAQPRWRADGKELFYIRLDRRLVAVPVKSSSADTAPSIGTPAPLFEAKVAWGPLLGVQKQQYAVSPDGKRFLINMVVAEENKPITMVINWRPPISTDKQK